MTDEMLAAARRTAPLVAERIGYATVEFRKGLIQDLALDLEWVERWLAEHPVADADAYLNLKSEIENLKFTHPLVARDSVDVVVSNCVLNLVEPTAKKQLFFRSVTIEAFKGNQGECFERHQAVSDKGPFREVLDDDHHRLRRGEPVAVCDKTYNLVTTAPSQCCDDGNGACG